MNHKVTHSKTKTRIIRPFSDKYAKWVNNILRIGFKSAFSDLDIFIRIMRLCLLILTLALTGSVAAQTLTISAKVQDKATQEPLPFASVGILGKPIRTVTNLNGEFDFHLPSEYRNEILTISMLGYGNFEAPVWSLLATGTQIIHMEKTATYLDEVVVVDTLSGGDIMRIAMSRLDENYPQNPFILDGFYRDIKKVGGTYISMLEAAVQIYDADYTEPRNKFRLKERVKLVEVRRSLGYESRFTDYFDQENLLEDLLLHNNIRYRQLESDLDFFIQLRREKDSYYNGHSIYVLNYSDDFSLRIYIDKENYAIIHMEYKTGPTNLIVDRRKDLYSKFDGLTKTIDFRSYQGKMFLNYMTLTSKINWYDTKTDRLNFETELHQQLLINKIHPNTGQRITSTEKMRNYGLQYQDLPYNRKFWENYNVIKETPLDKEILADLEKHLPLDRQFEN